MLRSLRGRYVGQRPIRGSKPRSARFTLIRNAARSAPRWASLIAPRRINRRGPRKETLRFARRTLD
jgi:hypothetical protein